MSEDVRLPVPNVVEWPIFPFEGDFKVRKIEPPFDEERLRHGDPGGPPCGCEDGDKPDPVWTDGTWAVTRILFAESEAGFPSYMLQTVEHMDFGEMSEELAAQFGVMSLRMERALTSLPNVGRVHINRWGDGGAHMHVWFLGRPFGAWQFSGYMLPLWGFILPPLDEVKLAENDRLVAAHLDAAAGQ